VDTVSTHLYASTGMLLVIRGPAKISKRGSTLVVYSPKVDDRGDISWEREAYPLLDLELVVVVGRRAKISTGAILMLAEANVPLVFHSRRVDSILLSPFAVRIAEVRRRLYKLIENLEWRIIIGRAFIEGKLIGMANVARYFTYKESEKNPGARRYLEVIAEVERARREEIKEVRDVKELRIHEAKWSKWYWELLSSFIPPHYEFTGRNPKSGDPINSAINYSYAILYGLCTHALIAAGLDPYAGIIHVERAGRTSLTYDFSEMFKPAAIHAVIVASRIADLKVGRDGYLNKNSLSVVTKALYRNLRRRLPTWRHTVRGFIYRKAWELRANVEKGEKFIPFTYRVK